MVKYSTEKSFGQSGDYLERLLTNLVDASNSVLKNQILVEALGRSAFTEDVYGELEDFSTLSQELALRVNDSDVYRMLLYVDDSKLYSTSEENFLRLSQALVAPWYPRLKVSSGNLIWQRFNPTTGIPPREASLSCLRLLLDPNNYENSIAVLRADIRAATIDELLDKASPTTNSVSYLIDPLNNILSASQTPIPRSVWLPYVEGLDKVNSGSFFGEWGSGETKAFLGVRKLTSAGLLLISVIPYRDLMITAQVLRRDLFILLLALSCATFFVAIAVSRSLSRRVQILDSKMQRIYWGEFTRIEEDSGNDEISDLVRTFNFMSDRLAALVEERFQIGQKAREFELKALQAQINPHFLYNTLDLIKWTAINHRVTEISDLVTALSRFYKISLNSGDDFLSLAEEIDHARLYVQIQNQKYQGAFDWTVDAEPGLLDFTTLKILLQPIVENAIVHGILAKDSKHGSIVLRVRRYDDYITLEVSDDGVGLSPEAITRLPYIAPTREGHGYGLRNIDERIKLHFGPDYGLTFASTPGQGTTVTIRMPVRL